MKFIVGLFMLFLIAAWGYISWYWYTCNIKGFCDENMNMFTLGDNEESDDDAYVVPKTPTISIEDVSREEPTQVVEITEEITIESEPELEPEDAEQIEESEPTVCEPIITEPIQLGGQNDPKQVEALEAFLNTQGNTLPIDGNYDAADNDAVKAFQLEYRSEILDPWGLTNPTGYVYKTTMEKINEVACE